MNYTAEQVQDFDKQTFEFLQIENKAHVLTITLNRPEKKNAMHPIMMAELAYCAAYARYHNDIWCVVLQANGDIFCAGADLKAFAGQADAASKSTIPMPQGEILVGELFPQTFKPCIAKVHGDVYAGGFLLICGCTYVIASEGVKLGLPEVKRGIWPMQVMASLTPILPARTLLDFCIRGLTITAQEAYEMGLVTHLVKNQELHSTVENLVNEICENAPAAIRMGLQAFYEMKSIPPNQQHAYLKSMLANVLASHDAQEGIKAFMEKRKPNWTGL